MDWFFISFQMKKWMNEPSEMSAHPSNCADDLSTKLLNNKKVVPSSSNDLPAKISFTWLPSIENDLFFFDLSVWKKIFD